MSNVTSIVDLRPGDHIYCWSSPGHHHHGVYIGAGFVVHMFGDTMAESKPRLCQLTEFTNTKRRISVARYNSGLLRLVGSAAGTSYSADSDPWQMVVRRALLSIGDRHWNYSLLTENCDCFARYCKTGVKRPSLQAGLKFATIHVTLAAGSANIFLNLARRALSGEDEEKNEVNELVRSEQQSGLLGEVLVITAAIKAELGPADDERAAPRQKKTKKGAPSKAATRAKTKAKKAVQKVRKLVKKTMKKAKKKNKKAGGKKKTKKAKKAGGEKTRTGGSKTKAAKKAGGKKV